MMANTSMALAPSNQSAYSTVPSRDPPSEQRTSKQRLFCSTKESRPTATMLLPPKKAPDQAASSAGCHCASIGSPQKPLPALGLGGPEIRCGARCLIKRKHGQQNQRNRPLSRPFACHISSQIGHSESKKYGSNISVRGKQPRDGNLRCCKAEVGSATRPVTIPP